MVSDANNSRSLFQILIGITWNIEVEEFAGYVIDQRIEVSLK